MNRYPRTILATCCVPWNEDGTIAETIFRESIRFQIGQGFDHLYVFGTAGEGYAVSDGQFDDVVRIFVDETRGRGATPMAGVISLSLTTVIERIERCAALGIEEMQISLPSWGRLSDRELTRFFEETCGRFPEIRFLHYNLGRAGRLVTADEYAALAERFPNLAATKHGGASMSDTLALIERAGVLRHFFTELGFGYGCLFGDPGFLISIASINPRLAHAYFQAGRDHDIETSTAIGRELAGIGALLAKEIGSEAHMDGAFDKIFCKLHDPRFPLRLLPPYEGAAEAAFHRFRESLIEQYPHWLKQSPHHRKELTQ